MYSYIGVLVNDSGTFDIADPLINPIFCQQHSVPRENQTLIKVRSSLAGIYDAWHLLDDSYNVKELLVLHHTYSFEDLEDFTPHCLGVVCVSIGRAVCIVDERYHFDPRFSYFKIESEALYDGDEILKRLPSAPYPAPIKEKLCNLITELRLKGKHPTGEDIQSVIQGYGVWEALCSNKIYSSHWSVDVFNRLNGPIPAAIYKGGVVSISNPGFLACYTYRNSRGMSFAIRIPLEEIDITDLPKNKAEIINFPKASDFIETNNFTGINYE